MSKYIEDTVREIVSAHTEIKLDRVTLAARFVEDLAVPSLTMVELVLALEENFKIEIDDDDVAGLKTVGEAAAYVISHLSQKDP